MVDYQGPLALRSLADGWKIPIFNRVREVNFNFRDVNRIKLDQDAVARLHHLERISFSKRSRQKTPPGQAVTRIVPACRLVAVNETTKEVTATLKAGDAFLRCDP